MVRINSTLSYPCLVTSGVPQGSALGPLLFNIYNNDISDHLDASTLTKLYADDMKLYSQISLTSASSFQDQLTKIYAWSLLWQLKISYSKCNIFILGQSTLSPFYFHNSAIMQVNSIKDLGITIDSDLKFDTHINTTVTKAKQRSSLILRCFLSRNLHNLLRAYKVYVRPLVEYASVTWSPSYLTQIKHVESIQRNYTKRLPGCHQLTYTERLAFLKLQSLEHRRLLADLSMTYNIISGLTCLHSVDFFVINNNPSLRGHSKKISVPYPKLISGDMLSPAALSQFGTRYHRTSFLPLHCTYSNAGLLNSILTNFLPFLHITLNSSLSLSLFSSNLPDYVYIRWLISLDSP